MIELDATQGDVAWPDAILPVSPADKPEQPPAAEMTRMTSDDPDSDCDSESDIIDTRLLLSHQVSAVLEGATQEINISDAGSDFETGDFELC